MAMKLVRKTADYKIFLRGDNRYAVQNAAGKPSEWRRESQYSDC
jgi:hypothetical protein